MPLPSRASGPAELRAALAADLRVNAYRADRLTVGILRLGQAAHGRPGLGAFVARRLHGLLDSLWTRGVVGAELPRTVLVGPGLRLPHSGRGVVLHPAVVLGSGVTLYHRVTMGVRGGNEAPTVGDGVYIGCGAAILGGVAVGDGAKIGANAVVLRDVPAGATAVGVPAQVRGAGA